MDDIRSNPWHARFQRASLNSSDASRLTIWLARTFGDKITGTNGDASVTAAWWRGKLYLVNYKRPRATVRTYDRWHQ